MARWSWVSWTWERRQRRVARWKWRGAAGEGHRQGHSETGGGGLGGGGGGGGEGAEVALAVGVKAVADLFEVAGEIGREDRRKDGAAVAAAFGIADGEFTAREVDVLHAQGQRFEETQAGSIQDLEDEAVGAGGVAEDGGDFGAGQDDGDALGTAGADEGVEPRQVHRKDMFEIEQERGESLVLRRCAHAAFGREMRQEGRRLALAESPLVGHAVEFVETGDPGGVGLSRPWTVVPRRQARIEAA